MRIVVVALGRPQALGERARISTWKLVLGAAGHEVLVVRLLDEARSRLPDLRHLALVAGGAIVPETLRWSPRTALAIIEPFAPDAVIAVTARAHHPALVAASPHYVLDLVDVLSASYRDRGLTMNGWRSAGYVALGRAHWRFERLQPRSRTVLAGHSEALEFGAAWVPLVRTPPAFSEPHDTGADVVFFGNLGYAPNVEAVIELGKLWPAIQKRRPGTVARIAGARPAQIVRDTAVRHGWELVADFEHLHDVLGGARVAVAPLRHASGIQTKILDAADHGVCQLLTPTASRGLHPTAPFPICALGTPFVERLVQLLDDSEARRVAGAAGRDYIERWHRPECWIEAVEKLLGG